MSLLFRLRCMWAFSRYTPWVNPDKWEEKDAINLNTFLKSDSGKKLSDYMTAFVLRQQAEAVISTTNLEHKCGYSVGAKAILTQLEQLGEAKNFTDDEGSD